jgi:hypothetical protein
MPTTSYFIASTQTQFGQSCCCKSQSATKAVQWDRDGNDMSKRKPLYEACKASHVFMELMVNQS